MGLLQREGLVDGEADTLAGHHVHVAGQQVGLQRRGVLDVAEHDALEAGLGAGPVRVRLQHDLVAAVIGGDHVRAVVQPGVDRRAVVVGAVDVGAGRRILGDHRALDVLRQDLVPLVVVGAHAVEVQHGGLVVHDIDARGAAPRIAVGEAAIRVAAQLPGEGDVLRGDGLAIAPLQAGLELDGHGHALGAVRPVLDLGQAVIQRRQLGAEQAGVVPIRVEGGDLPDHEAHHVAAHHLWIDVRLQRGRELGDPDGQRVVARLGMRQAGGGEQYSEGGGAECHWGVRFGLGHES